MFWSCSFTNFIVLVVLAFVAAFADVGVIVVVAIAAVAIVAVVVGPFGVSFSISQDFAVAVTTAMVIALVGASTCVVFHFCCVVRCSTTFWFVLCAPLVLSICSPRSLLRTLSL